MDISLDSDEKNYLLSVISQLKNELEAVKMERDSLHMENLMLKEESQRTSANLRNFFNEDQVQAFKYANAKSIRWKPETCEKAISLRYRIGATNYENVRLMLPLPSISTLLRRLEAFEIKTGINEVVIDYMKILFSNLPANERRGVLVVDRMSVIPGEDQDKHGERVGHDTLKKSKKILATEGLAILFCGTVKRIKLVVAHHYTEKSVDGNMLRDVMIECINKLLSAGIWIDAVISDMGPENTSMYKAFGMQFIIKNENPSIPHPSDKEQKLWLVADTSHLKKNLSNNFRNQKRVKIPPEIVDAKNLSSNVALFGDVLKIYTSQKDLMYKSAQKLTKEVIAPDQYQKMRVKNSTQLFHSDVYTSIQFLFDNDEGDVEKFLDESIDEFVDDLKLNATAFFLKMCDKWGNFMKNRSKPIMLQDQKQVEDALEFLEELYRFFKGIRFDTGNLPCLTGARLASRAIAELIVFYQKCGLEKFLPGWFTSDAVENLFSCIRKIRPLPSCKEFSQQIRSEAVKRFTEITAKSSYEHDDSFEFGELSFLDFLKTVKNETPSGDQFDDAVLKKLEEINNNILSNIIDLESTSIFHNELELNSFFFVCGFLVNKTLKKTSCEKCHQLLIESVSIPTPSNKLFRIKKLEVAYKLTEPSEAVFRFLVKLENLFIEFETSEIDCSVNNFKIKFLEIAMSALSLDGEHCENITEMLVKNFVGLRIYMTLEKRNKSKRATKSSKTMR